MKSLDQFRKEVEAWSLVLMLMEEEEDIRMLHSVADAWNSCGGEEQRAAFKKDIDEVLMRARGRRLARVGVPTNQVA